MCIRDRCSIVRDIQEKQAPLHGKSWGTNALMTDGDIDNGATKSNTRIGKGKNRKLSTDNDIENEAKKNSGTKHRTNSMPYVQHILCH